TVKFNAPGDTYNVHVMDATGATVQTLTNVAYDASSASKLTLPGGVQVSFSGVPADGDTFKIEPASAPDYVATAGANTGDATIFSPSLSDYSISRPGDVFSIAFTGPDQYEVTVTNAGLGTTETFPPQSFVPGRENTLSL